MERIDVPVRFIQCVGVGVRQEEDDAVGDGRDIDFIEAGICPGRLDVSRSLIEIERIQPGIGWQIHPIESPGCRPCIR